MLFKRISWFALIALSLAYFTCKNSKDPSVPTVKTGEWKVSYYFDRTDKTAFYAPYIFEFKPGGQLFVRTDTQTWSGTWSTACDDSTPKLCLTFEVAAPSLLRELAEDWHILSMTDTLMRLEHRSGGGRDTEILHFSRL
ncbi:MAG: hypothetical protein RMJ33_10320 [Saprospiraceae bacterium]|nr:hypothetical protein [Saprospiraceae bacterium]MDW8230221.1 hypothetical protein [Saprospiraceae bacterium]